MTNNADYEHIIPPCGSRAPPPAFRVRAYAATRLRLALVSNPFLNAIQIFGKRAARGEEVTETEILFKATHSSICSAVIILISIAANAQLKQFSFFFFLSPCLHKTVCVYFGFYEALLAALLYSYSRSLCLLLQLLCALSEFVRVFFSPRASFIPRSANRSLCLIWIQWFRFSFSSLFYHFYCSA